MADRSESTKSLLIYIQTTMDTIKEMVDEIKDDAEKIDAIEYKLQSMMDVEMITRILKDKDATFMTRIGLIEKQLADIESKIGESDVARKKETREKNVYMLKLIAISLPGIVSLVMMIIKAFTN